MNNRRKLLVALGASVIAAPLAYSANSNGRKSPGSVCRNPLPAMQRGGRRWDRYGKLPNRQLDVDPV